MPTSVVAVNLNYDYDRNNPFTNMSDLKLKFCIYFNGRQLLATDPLYKKCIDASSLTLFEFIKTLNEGKSGWNYVDNVDF